MHETNFIVREPLLDPNQRVVGYELSWQHHHDQVVTDDDLEALIGFVADNVNDEERGWLLRDKILFLDAVPAMLSRDALFNMPPERTVLTLRAEDLANPDTLAAAQGLKAGGVGISIRDGDLTRLGRHLNITASYVEVRFSGADVAALQGSLPCAWPIVEDQKAPPHPPIAVDRVAFAGEIVAVVVARTP
ncbi:MAG: hypothetical protein ACLGI6_23315, partial [Gammaproteobacteria bacterium]